MGLRKKLSVWSGYGFSVTKSNPIEDNIPDHRCRFRNCGFYRYGIYSYLLRMYVRTSVASI